MSHVWTETSDDRLIEMWQERPCLYDTTLVEFHYKEHKRRSLQEMADELGVTVHQVTTRMTTLRTNYGRINRGKSGDGVEDNPRKVWLQTRLRFLLPHIKPRASRSNIDLPGDIPSGIAPLSIPEAEGGSDREEPWIADTATTWSVDPNDDADDSPVPNKSLPKTVISKKSGVAKKQRRDEETEALKAIADALTKPVVLANTSSGLEPPPKDEIALFSDYIGQQLRSISNRRLYLTTKHKIESLLFEAVMEDCPNSTSTSFPNNYQHTYTPPENPVYQYLGSSVNY